MNKCISSGDVCTVTGIAASSLDRWCSQGVLKPEEHGKGRGTHRRYTLEQTVAIAYANRWREHGAGLEIVRQILEFLATTNLVAAFNEGRTHLLVVPGKLRLVKIQMAGLDRLDVSITWKEVCERVKQLATQPNSGRSGRRRGLAHR